MSRPCIVVVSDHPLVSDRIRSVLEPDFKALTLVAHPESVVAAVGALQPALLVVDLDSRSLEAERAVRDVLEQQPNQPIVCIIGGKAPDFDGLRMAHHASLASDLTLAVREVIGGRPVASRAPADEESVAA